MEVPLGYHETGGQAKSFTSRQRHPKQTGCWSSPFPKPDQVATRGNSGTVNGAGDYGFILTATDGQVTGGGGVDKFRIKIWVKNADGADGAVVYDNQLGVGGDNADPTTAIAGGSIVIHK